MGFWNFIKELLKLWLFSLWRQFTEGQKQGPNEHKYIVEYPKEYTQEYFQNGFSNYRWNPIYKTHINNLYNNENHIYRRRQGYRESDD